MTAKIWDAKTGQELFTLTDHDGSVNSAACSPDGQRIVTASGDNTAKVWETQTGTELSTLIGHGSGILSAAYSANGQRIVIGSVDNTAKIWMQRRAKNYSR